MFKFTKPENNPLIINPAPIPPVDYVEIPKQHEASVTVSPEEARQSVERERKRHKPADWGVSVRVVSTDPRQEVFKPRDFFDPANFNNYV